MARPSMIMLDEPSLGPAPLLSAGKRGNLAAEVHVTMQSLSLSLNQEAHEAGSEVGKEALSVHSSTRS